MTEGKGPTGPSASCSPLDVAGKGFSSVESKVILVTSKVLVRNY